MSPVYWILILNLWILKATSLQAGSRTVLREIGNNNGGGGGGGSDPKDYAVEFNVTNFDGVLKDTPGTYAIVEFFAHCCGLWVLMHSLSVRIEDGESQFTFTSICDFIHNFFICEECRQHFYEMCSSVTSPFKKAHEFALWLWSAHNEVNERLMKEESSVKSGDPKFPKIIWLPRQLCPSCYRSRGPKDKGSSQIDWDHDEVFKFLISYYGNTLVSLYKEKGLLADDGTNATPDDFVASTNAVAVPVGAALAIALASCAFRALACYWGSMLLGFGCVGEAGIKITKTKNNRTQSLRCPVG